MWFRALRRPVLLEDRDHVARSGFAHRFDLDRELALGLSVDRPSVQAGLRIERHAEMREQVKIKMDDTATLADQAKELGVMWKALDAKETEEWKAKAEANDAAEAASPLAGEEDQDDE